MVGEIKVEKSFKKKLQREIAQRFIVLSFFISIIFLIIFIGFSLYIQNYQLTSESKAIESEFSSIKNKNYQILYHMNQTIIPEYLDGDINEREIYSHFYQEGAGDIQQRILVITDSLGNVVFSTEPSWNRPFFAKNYLKTMVETNKITNQIERIVKDDNKNHYLILSKALKKEKETIGYSMIFVRENNFLPNEVSYGTQYIIADKFDNIFSRSSNQFVEGVMEKVSSKLVKNRFFIIDSNLYSVKKTKLTNNITLYSYIMFLPLKVLIIFSIISVVILIIIFVYQSIKIAKKVAKHNTKTIDILVEETGKISDGSKMTIDIFTGDEFEYLAQSINNMLKELTELHKKTISLEKQNINFERKMLEAQFQPHFLYNTLETIRITSQYDPQLTQKIIFSLNRVLKYSINYKNKDNILSEDVEIIKDFLEINVIRFEKFTYEFIIGEGLESMKVPKLFLLPVIENSLKYGMRYRNDLEIKIKIFRSDNEVIFEVEDNGPGFEDATIENIYNQQDKEQSKHGLINSFWRLKIMFTLLDLRIENKKEGSIVQFVILEE